MTLPGAICDAHHHLMDHLPGMEYLPADLTRDVASIPEVSSTVFVECGAHYREHGPDQLRPVGETEWVASTTGPMVAAIVGYADLRLGERVEDVLEEHISAGRGRFRGIRQVAAWDPDPSVRPMVPDPGPGLLVDSRFRAGFARLGRPGLVFDAYLYFPQLPEVVDLARAFPDTTIVLDHLGGPIGIGPYADRRASLEQWRVHMQEAVTCANVFVKLGGMGMGIMGLRWHTRTSRPGPDDLVEAWRAPVEWCIEHFGADRCMFESNFPVDRAAFDYGDLWAAYDHLAAGASVTERSEMFYGTASRVYRLEADTDGPAGNTDASPEAVRSIRPGQPRTSQCSSTSADEHHRGPATAPRFTLEPGYAV